METKGMNNYDGIVISEANAVSGLADGNIYIVTPDEKFAGAVRTAKEHLFTMMDTSQIFYSYEIRTLENLPSENMEGNLFEAIRRGMNIIIPLSTPNVPEKQYLVAMIEQKMLDIYLPTMVMNAENITRSAIEDAMMNWAIADPLSCLEAVREIMPNKDMFTGGSPFKDMMAAAAASIIGGIGGMASAAMLPSKDILSTVTYRQSKEIFDRFVENCCLLKRTMNRKKLSPEQTKEIAKAQLEVDFVFNEIWGVDKSKEGFRRMFINNGEKKIIKEYNSLLNRDMMADKSKITFSIEKSEDGIDKRKKNDGNYRIYATAGKKKVLLHFTRKPSCIVYMMYLMDKYNRGNEVDTLKIADNREVFCSLFNKVYNDFDESDKIFEGLTSKISNGKVRQTRLKECYQDIQKVLAEAVREFNELEPPFVIPGENSHIAILQNRIVIPDAFKKMVLAC